MNEPTVRLLKQDLLGSVERRRSADGNSCIRRDTRTARWWLRAISRRLAAREARALERIDNVADVPRLLRWDGAVLERSWIDGLPMQEARPGGRDYYRKALRLLRLLHRAGVVHNDSAKEPNWLVKPDGEPALIDFQLATVSRRRGRLFRLLAREDLRHLLKHKRSYCAEHLSQRQLAILRQPSLPSRLYMATVKPVYMWVTRKVFGWQDREGAGDRRF